MTELEKLNAGLEYDFRDEELNRHKLRAAELCRKLNAAGLEDNAAREALIRELFGAAGNNPRVLPDFHCDNGKNIRVGDDFFANYNVTILDRAPVVIGDGALLALGVVISTATTLFCRGHGENICAPRNRSSSETTSGSARTARSCPVSRSEIMSSSRRARS